MLNIQYYWNSKKKLSVIYAMLLSTSMLLTFAVLILGACPGLVDPDAISPSGHLSKVILVENGEEDEMKYQRMLEWTSDKPNYLQLRRKPLLEDDLNNDIVVSATNSHHSRHQRTHKVTHQATEAVYRKPQSGSDPEHSSASHRNRKDKTPASEQTQRRLPQAIIIGVKKGGTRALLEFLRMHPDVRAPGPEPHFFDRNYDKGLDWYRSQMPATYSDQVTMEKTPSYFVTKGVPGRIFNMSKNVKFIVVVRDPVTRAISDYAQALAKRDNISSFEEMALEDNSTGLVATSWGAIRIGVYAKHLERWLQHFPLSQMHFVSGENMITDPAGEIDKVQDFLALDRLITDRNFLFNNTKGFPCLVRPDRIRKAPHCLSKTKGRHHPKIDSKVVQRLRDFFRPFNQKFYQMVGHDFGWS